MVDSRKMIGYMHEMNYSSDAFVRRPLKSSDKKFLSYPLAPQSIDRKIKKVIHSVTNSLTTGNIRQNNIHYSIKQLGSKNFSPKRKPEPRIEQPAHKSLQQSTEYF